MSEGYAMVPLSMIGAPVNHRAFRVLVAVLAHSDASGRCHPSNNRLAEVTGLTRRDVIRCLHELEQAGSIRTRTCGEYRTIFVKRSGTLPLQPSGKVPPGVVANQAPPSGNLPPKQTSEQRERERELGPSGNLPLPDQVAIILGAVDGDGSPDPHAAALLSQWLAGKPERSVIAAAHDVMSRRPRDPLRYFLKRLEGPLPDPSAVLALVAAGDAPAPAAGGHRPSAMDAKIEAARQAAERYRAKRQRQESDHAGG